MDEELKFTIEKLKRGKIKVNTHSLFYDSGLILYLLYKTRSFAEVQWLFNEFISLGLKISKKMFNIVVHVIEDYEDVLFMLELREKFNILIGFFECSKLLAATNNLTEAETVLDYMRKHDIKFEPIIYGLLIEKSSSYNEALKYFNEIREKKALNTSFYHELLVKMDSKNLDEVILKEMSSIGIDYDEELCNFYRLKASLRDSFSFRQSLDEKFKNVSIHDILKNLDMISPVKIKEKPLQFMPDDNTKDWTEEEINIIVSDYFNMLIKELKGLTYNKTEHRRILKPKLNNRSDSSIEFKHQDISAVLLKSDLPYIAGYRPIFNAQDLLKLVVLKRFKEEILDTYQDANDGFYINESSNFIGHGFRNFVEEPPEVLSEKKNGSKNITLRKLDFAEKEQENKRLGEAGENFVVNLEKQKLVEIGRTDLEVRWVSKDKGDGLGYDISSFDKNGNEILIEVKTTNGGNSVPFYISDNELEVLSNSPSNYLIYRVFNFRRDPKLFILTAQDFLRLLRKPKNFVVYPTKSYY